MKTALVTGSSRGIGRAVARELAHQGWAVGINYLHREDKAQELVEELTAAGCQAAVFQADVADGAAVASMVKELGETFSPVELVVNNAGVAGQSLFQDISDEMWNRYLAVNLGGARNTIKAALAATIGVNYTFNQYVKVMGEYQYSNLKNVYFPLDKNFHQLQMRLMVSF